MGGAADFLTEFATAALVIRGQSAFVVTATAKLHLNIFFAMIFGVYQFRLFRLVLLKGRCRTTIGLLMPTLRSLSQLSGV